MSTTRAVVFCLLFLFLSILAASQDSPGRFELGGSFATIRSLPANNNIGPGLEADVNFGRMFALDAAIDWIPSSNNQTLVGFFGAKIGKRTQHFGFFGKVRPGFITTDNVFREATIVQGPAFFERFDRLTQRALDLGGVLEYYPAKHWALRWDAGDTLIFQELSPKTTVINPGFPVFIFPQTPSATTNHFQFSSGIHYRF